MRVQHELRQCPVHPDHGPLQHHKAAARKLGGGFKIHPRLHAGDVEMFLWRKREFARAAPAPQFHVIRLVRAIGDVRMRQVGNGQQRITQLNVQRRRLRHKVIRRRLAVGHPPAQRLKRSLIALRLGGPGVFRQPVDFGLRLLRLPDGVSPRLIQRKDFLRQPGQAPPRQGCVELCRIVADGADVVHGSGSFAVLVAPYARLRLCVEGARGTRGLRQPVRLTRPDPPHISARPLALPSPGPGDRVRRNSDRGSCPGPDQRKDDPCS